MVGREEGREGGREAVGVGGLESFEILLDQQHQ